MHGFAASDHKSEGNWRIMSEKVIIMFTQMTHDLSISYYNPIHNVKIIISWFSKKQTTIISYKVRRILILYCLEPLPSPMIQLSSSKDGLLWSSWASSLREYKGEIENRHLDFGYSWFFEREIERGKFILMWWNNLLTAPSLPPKHPQCTLLRFWC